MKQCRPLLGGWTLTGVSRGLQHAPLLAHLRRPWRRPVPRRPRRQVSP